MSKKLNTLLNNVPLKDIMDDPMIDSNFFGDSFANSYFPVLEGTSYGMKGYTISLEWLDSPEEIKNEILKYEENCDYMLSKKLRIEMFKEHSLFLIKESLKIFSPHSKKAQRLLTKLESLND